MAFVSVIKTAEIFVVARSTISKELLAFEKKKEKPHRSKILEESEKLSDTDRQIRVRIVRNDHSSENYNRT